MGANPASTSEARFVAHWAQTRPDAPAIIDDQESVSFAELDRRVGGLSATIQSAGLGRGSRIAVVGANGMETAVALLAVWRTGAAVALVNERLSQAEQERLIDFADVAGVLSCSPADGGTALRLRDTAHDGAAPAHGDAALILFTSGTTGAPKGVMLAHDNLDFVAHGIAARRGIGPSDCAYAALPLTHAFGLTSVLLGALCAGASVRILSRFQPEGVIAGLENSGGVTLFNGVPTMFARLCDQLEARAAPLASASLRFIGCGGSPLSPALVDRVNQWIGLPLHSGYGMSEAGPTITMTDGADDPRTAGVGLPLPGVSLSVRSPAGAAMPAGHPGEVYVRGPGIMRGYFKAPELTRDTVDAEGWLRTGDLGQIDRDGALHLLGRQKEMIIRSGFNVYPLEIEALVDEDPAVEQCAVLGYPEGEDEGIALFVKLRDVDALDAVLTRLTARIAPYKRPTRAIIIDDFPTTLAGKVIKPKLLERMGD
ncbi:hypothetical protein C0V72_15570 [Porphyrobacter sp. TH134]|nr:class I adenylate-forming enzyme family protein [Porphyrobacter sp. TH134]PLK22316.1 hypothetical protein C0V72_15570 [Porphyrobacter sp. TH134]